MTTPPRSRGPCSVIAATEFVTHTERHSHEAQEIHRARYGRLVRHRQSDGRAPRDGWLHGLRHSRRGAQTGQRSFGMLPLDVTSDESVEVAVNELMRLEGRIDLLVNNAGFGVAPAGAEESSIEQARSIFETNFFGIVRMTRAVVPYMRKQGGGRIINIGSVLGFLPMPYGALYAATKHAIEGYSESHDHELRTRGIRVSVIEPAYTKTPFDANFLEPDAKLDEYREVRAAVNKRVKEVMATAEQPGVVADVVLKAASAARPKLRYTAGGLASRLRLLRRFAPAGLVDAGIRRDLRLDAVPVAKTS